MFLITIKDGFGSKPNPGLRFIRNRWTHLRTKRAYPKRLVFLTFHAGPVPLPLSAPVFFVLGPLSQKGAFWSSRFARKSRIFHQITFCCVFSNIGTLATFPVVLSSSLANLASLLRSVHTHERTCSHVI